MKVNRKLLKSLYEIDHPSKSEYPIISFIINYCYKIPKLSFEIDHYSNIFITKNTTNPELYPLVIAHMDSVHDFKNVNRKISESNGIFIALQTTTTSVTQCGLSADDCNGILVALQLLESQPNLKVLFTTEEEMGGLGADEAVTNTEFFNDISFAIQADRRGNSDLITHTNGINSGSRDFVADIAEISKKYGYTENTGTFTDVGVIAEAYQISGVNVSCGYYSEHTDKEFCVVAELQNCLNYISEIITTLRDNGKRYPIEVTHSIYLNPNKYYGYDNFGDWDKYLEEEEAYENDSPIEEDLPCNRCKEWDCMNCKVARAYYG